MNSTARVCVRSRRRRWCEVICAPPCKLCRRSSSVRAPFHDSWCHRTCNQRTRYQQLNKINRSLRSVLWKAACLGLLPAFAWGQSLLPCPSATQAWIVATANDTAALASFLQCSSGSFSVEWFGHVVVSHTIEITQGTSLNITGASAGATADGNHTTQLFAVDGASSLHFTDMTLANGDAEFGGAVHAVAHARVSFSGTTTIVGNTAWYGAAIYVDSSSVTWKGEHTNFSNNHASDDGGAIMAKGASDISWDGVTVFISNSADSLGGAMFANESSRTSWSGDTTFMDNTAWSGGAMYADSSSIIWNGEHTNFSNNYASCCGGAILAEGSSDISWNGVTVFVGNIGHYKGGAVFANESSSISWSGSTRFTENTAYSGGAMYIDRSSVSWDAQEITFGSNYARGSGGAILATNASSISAEGEMVFVRNAARSKGGAAHFDDSSNGSWKGVTNFVQNSADQGGAVVVESSSNCWWDGETIFMDNSADDRAGGVYASWYSNIDWTGNSTFQNNSARDGGGLYIYKFSIGTWSGNTTFTSNISPGSGAGLNVHTDAEASWTGVTTFTGNIADRAGAMFVWESDISWTGNTTFTDNVAHRDGGAVYATVNAYIAGQGTTLFRNNTATTGNGGALGIYGYLSEEGSFVNISGETTFDNNFAFANGGAIFSSANTEGQHFEGVIFRSNSAGIGGAVATFGTGNGDEQTASPTVFFKCQFLHNTATETGGAVESAFGQTDIVSSYFDSNAADVGGALRVGGVTNISGCSFISNIASSSGLAVAAVGSVQINASFFQGNVFTCEEGKFLEEIQVDGSNNDRYNRVCTGCPTWNECANCTVGYSNFNPTCSNALEHTSANEAGSTLETLSIESGYWRATAENATILACYNMAACRGGQTGAETFCGDGYMGPYCSVCQAGYSSSMSTICTRCSSSRRQWFVAITVIAGSIVACAMAVFSVYLMSTNFEDRKDTYMHHTILRRVPLQAFKSIVVVWQILTQFASVANVTYPGVYQTFLSGLNVINIDVGFVMTAGCLWSGIDFHARLIAGTIWPLAILGLLGMTYSVALFRNATADDSVRKSIINKHLSAVLLLLFFVYSSVSSTVFRMFACDSLDDGEEYLRADYRIMCTDATHRALQVYAAIMIAVYPVGIPLLFVVLLYRYRDILSASEADKSAAQSISSIWAPYRSNRYYYEVVECGRRIMLTGVVVFIYPNDTAQIAITILTSFLFFVVSEVLSPYESVSDTWLSRSGHILIFFSMFNVLLVRVDVSQESSESQQVLAGVLVVGHVVMIVAVLAEAVGMCYASRREGRIKEEDVPSIRALRRPSMSMGQGHANK